MDTSHLIPFWSGYVCQQQYHHDERRTAAARYRNVKHPRRFSVMMAAFLSCHHDVNIYIYDGRVEVSSHVACVQTLDAPNALLPHRINQ